MIDVLASLVGQHFGGNHQEVAAPRGDRIDVGHPSIVPPAALRGGPGPVDGQKVKLGIDDDDDAGFKGSVGDSVERPEEFGKVSKTGDVAGVAGLMFTVGVLPPLPLPELAEEVVKFELDFLEGVGDGEGEGGYTCFPFTSLLFSDPLPLVTFTSLLSVPLDQ